MKPNRRQFLAAATAATTAALATRASAADRVLKLGVIGMGWYGMVDAKAALKVGGVEISAICDVDSEHLAKSAAELEKLQGRRPRTFKLYDDLLQSPGLDALIIATPPHWHALQFIAALDKNLDVYCEKPIAYDVREAQAMVAAASRSDRVVQVGFQRRQSKALAEAKRLIDSGRAGRIVQVDAQIHYRTETKDPTPQAPPASLDWNLWCGPGPKIPYSPQVGHFNWRLEKTSGHGHLVDWGIHLVDQVRVVLGESTPKRITAAGGLYELKGKITTPDTLTVHFEFARCPLVWRHRIWGRRGIHARSEQRDLLLWHGGHAVRDRHTRGCHSSRQEQGSAGDGTQGRSWHGPHGRFPGRGASPPQARLHDGRRRPVDRHGETGDDRLRDRDACGVGRAYPPDRRQPGRRETLETRVPFAVETPVA